MNNFGGSKTPHLMYQITYSWINVRIHNLKCKINVSCMHVSNLEQWKLHKLKYNVRFFIQEFITRRVWINFTSVNHLPEQQSSVTDNGNPHNVPFPVYIYIKIHHEIRKKNSSPLRQPPYPGANFPRPPGENQKQYLGNSFGLSNLMPVARLRG